MPVEATLGAFLDKDWENRSLAEIFKAPVSALQGVSEGDADLLKQAFHTKTVGDLGKKQVFPGGTAAPPACRGWREVELNRRKLSTRG